MYTKKDYKDKEVSEELDPLRIIEALGGKDNIVSVSNCLTRLRVKIKNIDLVSSDSVWKDELQSSGLVRNPDSVQVIYGTKVVKVARQVKDILQID